MQTVYHYCFNFILLFTIILYFVALLLFNSLLLFFCFLVEMVATFRLLTTVVVSGLWYVWCVFRECLALVFFRYISFVCQHTTLFLH